MYVNKVILLGNLTRDPETEKLPHNGTAVTKFGLATNHFWKDDNGSKKEEVEFHNIVSYGKQAENAAAYLQKGRSVYIEGRKRTQSWEKEGTKHSRTDIIAEKIQYGPRLSPEAQAEAEAFAKETGAAAEVPVEPAQ